MLKKNKNRKRQKSGNLLILFSVLFIAFIITSDLNGTNKTIHGNVNDNPLLEKNPQISGPEINITTPENKTYYASMNGYYPGSIGFESDLPGSYPSDWYVRSPDATHIYGIETEFNNHKNVYKIRKNGGSDKVESYINITSSGTTGTIEFWLYKDTDSSTDPTRITLRDGVGSGNYIPFGFENGELFIGGWAAKAFQYSNALTKNLWHHIRVDFNFSKGWQIQVDDTWYGSGYAYTEYIGSPTSVDSFHIETIFSGDNPDYAAWVDAIGYSWAPNYNIGNNLAEGLLLSYNNLTTLEWMGYSLDNQANKTIVGNTTIPLPNDGLHTIQVYGNETSGTMYEFDKR